MISKRVSRAGAGFSGHFHSPNSLTAAAGACFDTCRHHHHSRAAQRCCPAACTTLPPSSPRVMSSAGSKSRHGIVRGAFDGAFGGVTTGSVCANPSGIVNITINGRKLRVRKRGKETIEEAVEREIGDYSDLKFEEVVMESESDESDGRESDEDAPLPTAQGVGQTPRSRPKVDKYSPTKHMTCSERKHVQERATGRRITGSPTRRDGAAARRG